ncbi:hypothetical protein L6164_007784 [Bauhinia variegata]|uniref:Uncharacterized protein n=1 Tax=Bauhinia variegata TaxID=167791 RepID=A0ACB9PHL2_BAUVA|nr:hypothetical protein L6164_007784 [Bauhinia variegata]
MRRCVQVEDISSPLRSSILSNETESNDKENHQVDMAQIQGRILAEAKNLMRQLNELQLDKRPIEDLAEDQPLKVESPQNMQPREPEDQIGIAMQSPSPTHLPDGPLISNSSVAME